MNCLTNKQLQELIDVEVSSHQQELYEQHLSECQQCNNIYNEQKKWAELVKAQVFSTATTISQIPEFKVPARQKRKSYRIPLWAKVAAVMIPAICFWKMSDKPEKAQFTPTPENLLMYEMATNSDANRSFQDKMIITTVTNENGEVIECSTN